MPHDGPMCDLMWSDPEDKEELKKFRESPRGAGFLFGEDIVEKFNRENRIELIARAH